MPDCPGFGAGGFIMSAGSTLSDRFVAVVVLTALGLAVGGCSGSGSPEAAADPTSTASPTPTGTPTGKGGKGGKQAPDDPETTGTASPVPDVVVATYTPIKRDGKAPKPTVTAAAVPFNKVVRYTDGLRLDIVEVKQGKVEGKGPGVLVGQPSTSVALRMTNNSDRAVDLSAVVVTMLYGRQSRQARPVYDNETAKDFTGSLAVGRSADATYLFSVPRDQLKRLRMYVDFDGIHTVAQFRGSLA